MYLHDVLTDIHALEYLRYKCRLQESVSDG